MKVLCVVILTFLGFMETTSEKFKVVGPAAPLVAKAGEDLVLPCSLQHNNSTVDMMVEWIRTDLSETDRLVHLYEDYETRNEKQMKSYRGRTALFKEELRKGNTSLKLTMVQTSDEGAYKCSVKLTSWHDDITVHIKVTVHSKVVGAAAPLVVEVGEDLVLPCSLQSKISAEEMMVEWIRPDNTEISKLVHLYEDHRDRNNGQMEFYRGRTALFKEELQKGNTSLKLSAVQPSDEGVFKCLIRYRSWHDDVTVYVEVKELNFHAWKIALICFSMFAVIFVAFTAYLWKEKISEKELSPAQCSTVAYMRVKSQYVREELALKSYNTSEEGYRRLIPAMTNCRKACFAGCNLTLNSVVTLSTTLKTENSSLKELDLNNNDLYDSGVELLSAGLSSSHCKLEILRLSKCAFGEKSCEHLGLVLQTETTSLKELVISNNELHDSGVEKLSAGLKSSHCKLEILRLSKCTFGEKSCEDLGSVLQTETTCLKELDISNNELHDSGVEKLSAALKSSHCKLEIFRLSKCTFGEKSCEDLGSVLQTETTCLKELDISNNELHDSGVEKLSVGLRSSHCKLEILRLSMCTFGEKSCEHLSSALQTETTSLKELDISINELHDSGVEKLSVGLKSSHCKLKILRLSKCTFGEKSCEHLSSVLQTETTCLKELDISINELHDSGVEKLSVGLKSSHCKLEILRLSLCNFGEKSCEYLGSVLQTETTSLKELNISNNELHDPGVEKLSAGLKSSHCKLEILRLSGCMVREKGCSSLASALSSNPSHLKELDITYNHTGESGVKLLYAKQEDAHCSLNTLRVEHEGKMTIRPKMYSCEVTLDPNTAHSLLSLSDGNRKVECVGNWSYPDHPERFDYWDQVLSRESLTGRCYWEAEWSGTVYISVSYKSIKRKGDGDDCLFGRNVKSWSLYCTSNVYSAHHNNISTTVSVPPSGCKRVGVYVDCPAGTLSFYSVSSDPHTLTHLHTFYTSFTEPLYTGFRICNNSSVCVR